METLLGFAGLLFVGMVTLLIALRHPAIRMVLLVAFLTRAGAALFGYYVATLPDGGADAVGFERLAWSWAQHGFFWAIANFTGPDSLFISWLISLLYAVTGRSPLMAQSLSLLAGMGAVFMCWRTAKDLWGEHAAGKAAWAAALFPMLINYSALVMRESYITFFLLAGLSSMVRWAKSGDYRQVIWAVGYFMIAGFFHGAMFLAVLMVSVAVGLREFCLLMESMRRGRLRLTGCLVLLAVLIGFSAILVVNPDLPKLGTPEHVIEKAMTYIQKKGKDSAAYPSWVIPSSPVQYVWALPVRIPYLLFAPFPWDIRKASHLLGFFDGLLYIGLTILLFRNRRLIWNNQGARTVLLISIPLIIAFAVGTSNFGTGLRHRAKFVLIFIMLATPLIPRPVFFKRIK